MTQQPAFDIWQAVATILPALGIGAMVGGIVVAFIKRGTDKEANSISEKDVNTRAASMGLEVLTEGLAELRTELKEAKVELQEAKAELKEEKVKGRERDSIMEAQSLSIEAQREKLSQQHDEIQGLIKSVDKLHEQRDLLMDHIAALEKGYPYPPGPPARPNWGPSLA
jgi:chromosome segregation ATPase